MPLGDVKARFNDGKIGELREKHADKINELREKHEDKIRNRLGRRGGSDENKNMMICAVVGLVLILGYLLMNNEGE